MKIVALSDTHGLHNKVILPPGDILIHAGDISKKGTRESTLGFLSWFSKQPLPHKIFIAGNHDFFLEKSSEKEIQKMIPDNIIYLNDSGISIDGIKIWGSPIQPYFFNWAFNRRRGAEIKKHWDLIPDDTDILITHGPPMGILDKTTRGDSAGCRDLLNKIKEINLKAHIFGHIHEAYGTLEQDDTLYVNPSLIDERYILVNDPVVFEI